MPVVHCALECYVQAILNLNVVDSLCTEMLISFCEVCKNKGRCIIGYFINSVCVVLLHRGHCSQ